MEYLAQNGYRVIPLAQLARFLEGKEPLPKKTVVITIDDGYRATYQIAYPILKKYGFPATVYLYSDFVGASDALTWPQMQEMVRSGLIEIQPHSKTHANLTVRLPGESEAKYAERMRREVDAPIAAISERLALGELQLCLPVRRRERHGRRPAGAPGRPARRHRHGRRQRLLRLSVHAAADDDLRHRGPRPSRRSSRRSRAPPPMSSRAGFTAGLLSAGLALLAAARRCRRRRSRRRWRGSRRRTSD